MKATFFIITNNTDNDSFYMNSSMLKEMNQNGMGIENHTSRHIEFPNISREAKIAIIEEAHHGLIGNMGCMIDSHDKLLSATFSAATFLVMHFTTLFQQSQPKCNIYSMNSFDVVFL